MQRFSPEDLAPLCVQRIVRDPSWVFRRKDSFELISDDVVARRMSIDFALPGDLRRDVGSEKQRACYVPLGLMVKAPGKLFDFDLVDESGRSLPLPTLRRNCAVSAATAVALAREVAGDALSDELAEELRSAISATSSAIASQRYQKLHPSLPESLRQDQDFDWLARTLSHSAIVVVPLVGVPDERRILRVSWRAMSDDLSAAVSANPAELGWAPYHFATLIPFAGARSYHVDFRFPPGLRATEASLYARRRRIAATSGWHRDMHLYRHDARDLRSVVATVDWRISSIQAQVAVFPALAATALLAASAVFASEIAATPNAPALLTTVVAVSGVYLAQTDGPLAKRLLSRVRRAVLRMAAATFAGATLIVFAEPASISCPLMTGTLALLAVVSGFSAYELWLTRQRSRRS